MKKITIGTFDISQKDIDYISDILRNKLLSVGPELFKFQNKCAKLCCKEYGLMVNSGQSAIEVAIEMAKIYLKKDKLKIICPATTYAATLWAIIRSGCEPVFVDIDHTYNIDYAWIESKVADVVLSVDLCGKAAIPSHYVKENYFIIEDACEAFGNPGCCYGDIICHSFYVSHIITTGCGGMICTNHENLYKWAENYIAHGRRFGGDFTKFTDEWVDRFIFDKVGVSYRANNLLASLGLSQLGNLEEMISKRKSNAFYLITSYLCDKQLLDNFIFPNTSYWDESVFQFFPILIKGNIDRGHFLKYLYKNGIDSRVLLSLTNQPAFIEMFGNIQGRYPNSKICNEKGFIIGCHQDLNIEDMNYVVQIFKKYIEEYK